MSVLSSVILFSFVLVDDYLVTFTLLQYLSVYYITGYERVSYDEFVSAYCYDLIKYYFVTDIGIELFYFEFVALLYSVLLAAGLDNCLHYIQFLLKPDSPKLGCKVVFLCLQNPLRAVNRIRE